MNTKETLSDLRCAIGDHVWDHVWEHDGRIIVGRDIKKYGNYVLFERCKHCKTERNHA